MFNPTSPVTGGTITGLTSPTYTLAADTARSLNENQWYVSALGGTQTGVVTHSANRPFTVTFRMPQFLKRLNQKFLSALGVYTRPIPVNTWEMLVNTKAYTDPTSYNLGGIRVRLILEAAPGIADQASGLAQINAALSLALGCATQQLSGIRDAALYGTK